MGLKDKKTHNKIGLLYAYDLIVWIKSLESIGIKQTYCISQTLYTHWVYYIYHLVYYIYPKTKHLKSYTFRTFIKSLQYMHGYLVLYFLLICF